MLLVSIASNKVEGLAVSKLLGIICCGIPLAWFSPQHLKLFGYLLPTYWITDMLIQANRNNITYYLFDFLIGTLCVFTWIYALYGIFMKNLDST
jgi:fluoroquinolone transport system permease protein